MAQRITRSATNREIAGSNPVTDNEIFSKLGDTISFKVLALKGIQEKISVA